MKLENRARHHAKPRLKKEPHCLRTIVRMLVVLVFIVLLLSDVASYFRFIEVDASQVSLRSRRSELPFIIDSVAVQRGVLQFRIASFRHWFFRNLPCGYHVGLGIGPDERDSQFQDFIDDPSRGRRFYERVFGLYFGWDFIPDRRRLWCVEIRMPMVQIMVTGLFLGVIHMMFKRRFVHVRGFAVLPARALPISRDSNQGVSELRQRPGK